MSSLRTKRVSTFASAFAFALALVTAYGCSTAVEEDDSPEATEDALMLRRGSVDHAAIAESTTIMLVTELGDIGPVTAPIDLDLDPYNQADPFAIGAARFRDDFARNLVKFDGMDGKRDWTTEQAAAWVGRMAAANYQVIDTSKPCRFGDRTYLEIERAQLSGREHSTCGGRMPNEDALDVTMDFLVRGPAASADDADAIKDGVDQATKKSGSTFPYLADMNGL